VIVQNHIKYFNNIEIGKKKLLVKFGGIMDKKKIYVIIATLIIIIIFSASAICNQCGLPINISFGDEEEDGEEESNSQTESQSQSDSGDSSNESETAEGDEEEPADDPDDAADDPDDAADDPDDDEVEPTTVIFNADPLQTGLITSTGLIELGDVFIGHMGGWDLESRGYISFNISELAGKKIQSANLKINSTDVYNPRDRFGNLIIGTIDFASAELKSIVKDKPASLITSFDWSTTNINYSGEALLNRIKSILIDGRTRLQIRLYYEHPIAYSGDTTHGISFNASNAKLEVIYLD